jgi:hypothetical protein
MRCEFIESRNQKEQVNINLKGIEQQNTLRIEIYSVRFVTLSPGVFFNKKAATARAITAINKFITMN